MFGLMFKRTHDKRLAALKAELNAAKSSQADYKSAFIRMEEENKSLRLDVSALQSRLVALHGDTPARNPETGRFMPRK